MTSVGPVRTCAACRTRRSQGALVRVVRNPDGTVCVDDPTRPRRDGRGVYLCRQSACITQAVKRQSLRRALHVEVPEEIYTKLCLLVTDGDGPASRDK